MNSISPETIPTPSSIASSSATGSVGSSSKRKLSLFLDSGVIKDLQEEEKVARASFSYAATTPWVKNAQAVAEWIQANHANENPAPLALSIGERRVELLSVERYLGQGAYHNAYVVNIRGLTQLDGAVVGQVALKVPKVNDRSWLYQKCDTVLEANVRQYLAFTLTHQWLPIADFYDYRILFEEAKAHLFPGCEERSLAYSQEALAKYMLERLNYGCTLVELGTPLSIPATAAECRYVSSSEEGLDRQLKDLFTNYKNSLFGIPLDFKRDNCAIGANNRLILIDPMHPNTVPADLEYAAATFAPRGSDRYHYLLN